MAYYSIMDMITWSPERRQFYERHGFDIGPQMASPMDAMRPQVQQPNIPSAQLDPSSHMGIGVDPSIGYLPNRQSVGDAWRDQMRFRTYDPSPPKVKQVITETEPGDPTPTKSVTTIDWEQKREDEQRAVAPDFLNMTEPGRPPIRDRTFPLPMRTVESGIPGIGIVQGAEVPGPESLNPNDYSRQQLYDRATSRLQNFGKYGVDPLVTEATAGQAFGGNLPYSTEVARESAIHPRGYNYEQRVVDGPESPEMGIAPYTSFAPPVEEDLNQTMNAIMMAESGGDPNAYNAGREAAPDDFLSWPRITEDSIGLFQINWNFWGDKERNKWKERPYDIINNATKHILGRDLRREDLFNPDVNTAAAYAIQAKEGFEPWSVYTSGKYKEKLPGLEGIYNTGIRAIDKVGRVGAGIFDDATNIGQGILDRAGQFAGQAVDFGQGLIDQSYNQQTQSTPEDIYKMQGIDTSVASPVRSLNLPIPDEERIGSIEPEDYSRDDPYQYDQYIGSSLPSAPLSEIEQFQAKSGLSDQNLFTAWPIGSQPTDPEDIYKMQGIDTSVAPPVTGQFIDQAQEFISPIINPDLDLMRQYDMFGTVPPSNITPLEEKQNYMDSQELLQRRAEAASQEGGYLGSVLQWISMLSYPADKVADGINALVRSAGGPPELIQNPVMGVNWLLKNIYRTPEELRKVLGSAVETVSENVELLGKSLAPESWMQYETELGKGLGLSGLLGSGENKEEIKKAATEEVKKDIYGSNIITTDPNEEIVTNLDISNALNVSPKEITSQVNTVADAQREANKIWAKFPQDIDSREDKYLHALKEMYKKAAILNVIANLTGQESMAPKFMELAADRFKKLEGFEGERRLANIAKVVFFREDGSLAIPPSKQAAFERAMKAGASLSEAQVISGYMDDEEKEKPKQWEPTLLQKDINGILGLPPDTSVAQARIWVKQKILEAEQNGNERLKQYWEHRRDEAEALIYKKQFGIPLREKTRPQKIDQLWGMYKASEAFTSTWEGFNKWLIDPDGRKIIDAILGEDETLESILKNPDTKALIEATIDYEALTITKEDMEK